jgi:hypothetical protein
MTKIITISDVKIRNLSISKNEQGEPFVLADYSLIEESGKVNENKSLMFKKEDLTTTEKTKISSIINTIIEKIKEKEEL